MNAAYAKIIGTGEIESCGKMSEMNDDSGFRVELTDDEVRTPLYAVQEAIKAWPGYPARPREEEQLQALRGQLFMMTLEMQFGPEA